MSKEQNIKYSISRDLAQFRKDEFICFGKPETNTYIILNIMYFRGGADFVVTAMC